MRVCRITFRFNIATAMNLFMSMLLVYVHYLLFVLLYKQQPTPGVNQYAQMLPHSEATLDHFLLPHPPYPSANHPKVKLDVQVCTSITATLACMAHVVIQCESCPVISMQLEYVYS